MPWWTVAKPALENGVTYVSNAYKNEEGNNKLTTVSPANLTGYIPIDPNSTDPIVKGTYYAVQTDGKITYKVDFNRRSTQFNSIQEIASYGYTGYNPGTTAKIKNEVQYVLSTSAKRQEVGPRIVTPPQADQQSGIPPASASAAASASAPTGTTGTTTSLPEGTGTRGNSPTGTTSGYTPPSSGMTAAIYRYPLDISDKQDCIKFEIFGLKRNPLTDAVNNVEGAFRSQADFGFGVAGDLKNYEKALDAKPIIMGIQGQIIDQNTVNWGAGELNELQRILASASATTMTSNADPFTAMTSLFTSLGKEADKNSQQLQSLLYTALLEQAVSAPNLLSRITGGILNPNMELLFQGPQLRPFNFNFKMSPRSQPEAASVKRIIKAFKRNMAPKVNNLFLQSPNVFKITYIHGSDENSKTNTHQSINLIKMCSLQNCSIDYTPLQTYMTYEDPEASMVSYNMSLSFSEITPIYQNDYDAENQHPIGF